MGLQVARGHAGDVDAVAVAELDHRVAMRVGVIAAASCCTF